MTPAMRGLLRSGLAYLLLQSLAAVADALVLVRIGLAQRTHVGGHLAHLLAIDAGDGKVRLLGIDHDLDAGGQRKLNLVRKSEGKNDRVLALQLGAVPDADNVEFLAPALGDSDDSIADQRARQPMERGLFVVLALGDQAAVLLHQRNAAGKHGADLALGAFHKHRVAICADRVLDAGWHGNWLLADTGHSKFLCGLRVAQCEAY